MAIRYVPSGTAELMGNLAVAAGEATAARTAHEEAVRYREQVEAFQREKEMRQFSAQLEADAEKRALAFQFEKMEAASRHDLALREWEYDQKAKYEISKELRERQEKDVRIKMVRNSKELNPEQKELAIMEMETEIPFYSKGELGRKEPDLRKQRVNVESDIEHYLDVQSRYETARNGNVYRLDNKGKRMGKASPEEIAYLEYAQQQIGQSSTALQGLGQVPASVPAGMSVGNLPAPTNMTQFEDNVKQLYQTNPALAKAYYNQYKDQF